MASITRQRVGIYTYLYESVSFRDELGRPRNKKTKVGKVDQNTGRDIYTPEYIERMAQEGISLPVPEPVSIPNNRTPEELTMEILSSVRSYGAYYLLSSIAEKTGVLAVLSKTLLKVWQQILNLACFMVATGDPLMYCEDWLSQTTAEGTMRLTSQRISELFSNIRESDRNRFYHAWMSHVQEIDYIALDITSISSYSELMQLCEWGYNRDNEDLKQINMCMLFGETTQLPIYQTIYQGSLKDVSTLQTTLKEVALLWPDITPKIVMDKGFFSKDNIQSMLLHEQPEVQWQYSFLMSVPFTSGYAKKLVASAKKSIDNIENTILTSEGAIRGVHKLRSWPGIGPKLHTMIYFNPAKAQKEKNELYSYVTELKQLAQKDPENKKLKSEFDKYLIIRSSSINEGGYTINIRKDVIDKKLETTGWMVLISNYTDDAQKAIDIYRSKDFVEKGFDYLKNAFDLYRLRVHSDERAQNKVFCGFIALILASAIDKCMKDKKLYSKYTMTELLRKVAQIKMATVNGERVFQPITKEQSAIFKAFDVPEPVG